MKLKKLIKISKRCKNIKNRNLLRGVEDEFAKDYTLLKIDRNSIDKELKTFMVYSSLPFSFDKNDNNKFIKSIWSFQRKCTKCGDVLTKMKALPTGNINAKYMVIGDAPGFGDNFNDFSRAWVYGPSSIILRLALAQNKMFIDTWFTNLLVCALKDNRNSNNNEIKNCFPFLKNQINKINPEKIILLGNHVQSKLEKMKKDTVNIYHPSYFVRQGKGYKEYAKHIKNKIKKG